MTKALLILAALSVLVLSGGGTYYLIDKANTAPCPPRHVDESRPGIFGRS